MKGATLTRRVVWRRNRRAPTVKLKTLEFDRLVVHVEGDRTASFAFPPDAYPIRHRPGPPEHWTLKIDPNLLRIYQVRENEPQQTPSPPGRQKRR